jgi:hypothetical protein
VQVFPLLGNSTAGLHQHEGTILWDAITVCRKGDAPITSSDLRVSDRQVGAAERHAKGWADRLARFEAVRFSAADHANLLRACLVAVALGTFGARGRGKDRLLSAVLDDLPSTTN